MKRHLQEKKIHEELFSAIFKMFRIVFFHNIPQQVRGIFIRFSLRHSHNFDGIQHNGRLVNLNISQIFTRLPQRQLPTASYFLEVDTEFRQNNLKTWENIHGGVSIFTKTASLSLQL